MVMLGYPTTLPVTMDDMIHHAKAVSRGARQALLVGDMPFMSYHSSTEQAIESAGRFIKEGGMHAVKLEDQVLHRVKHLIAWHGQAGHAAHQGACDPRGRSLDGKNVRKIPARHFRQDDSLGKRRGCPRRDLELRRNFRPRLRSSTQFLPTMHP